MNFPMKEAIASSWKIVWRHKIMWLFGVFASGGYAFTSFNFTEEDKELIRELFTMKTLREVPNLFTDIGTFWGLLLFVGLFTIGAVVVSLIFTPALLESIRRDKQGEAIEFKREASFGVKKMGGIFILGLLFSVPALILLAVVIFAIKLQSDLLVALMMLVFVVIAIAIALICHYAYCYLCFENSRALSSIQQAWKLFVANWEVTVLTNLVKIGLSIAGAIASILIVLISSAPFIILVVLTSMAGNYFIPLIFAFLGLLVVVAVALITSGLLNAWMFTFMTKVFWFVRNKKQGE